MSHRGSKESLHFTIYIRASQSESGRGLFMTIYQISLNFVKPVTNSKYVFHVQVKGNQNQICESEDQKSLQHNIEISKENNEIMKI